MLFYLASMLQQHFGPLRLFLSYTVLSIIALYAGFFVTVILIPRFYLVLPKDRGKEFSVGGQASQGKPTGAGAVFISIFVFLAFLLVPLNASQIAVVISVWLVMLTGYFDDCSVIPWGEYKKGVLDLVLSLGTAILIYYFRKPAFIWLPFIVEPIAVAPWLYIALATTILWVSINTTNCSDGVDGLSGTLVLIALISMGILFYFVLGHIEIAKYLLVPHISDGASIAVLIFALSGILMGYLWHNAYPSKVLMGDAGSRALGFFIGICVIVSGNPFLIFMTSTMLLINGGTGLLKVILLRFFNIRIFRNIRFPLHDHMRKTLNWSATQVLVKFAIMQILITLAAIGIIFKVR